MKKIVACCMLSIASITYLSPAMYNSGTRNHIDQELKQYIRNLALCRAIEKNSINRIPDYITLGANVNDVINEFDETPLHLACSKGNFAIVALLVIYGASIEQKNLHGVTPLLKSLEPVKDADRKEQERLKVVAFLLANNKPNACAYGQDTALHMACSAGYPTIAAYLIKKGAPVNAKAYNIRWTPLHYAVRDNEPEIVKLLLDAGAKPSPDAFGKTPYDYALHWNLKTIVNVFEASLKD